MHQMDFSILSSGQIRQQFIEVYVSTAAGIPQCFSFIEKGTFNHELRHRQQPWLML